MRTDEIVVGKEYAVVTGYGTASSRHGSLDRARVEETRVDRPLTSWDGSYRRRGTRADGVRVTLLDEKTGRKWRGLRDGPERVIRPDQVAHVWKAEVESRKRKEQFKRERDAEEAKLSARMKSIVEDLGELGIEVDWSPQRHFSGVYLDLSEESTFQLEAVLRAIVGGSDGLDVGALVEIAAEAKPEEEE